MAFCHSVYGLRFTSNLPIPGLPVRNDLRDPDVRVHLKEESGRSAPVFSLPSEFFHSSPNLKADGQYVFRASRFSDGSFGFFYGDGARFAIKSDGSEVLADGPENYAHEDTATYLVGPVMGFVLRLKGALPLHACSVAVGDHAIALVGPQGAGKSTSSAAFARLGYSVLSEDVTALVEAGGRYMVQPGYPRVNLWPESAEALFGDAHALPPVTPTWGKHFLALDRDEHRFQSQPMPLGGIFLLRERNASAATPRIEPMPAASAIFSLVVNTYGNYLLDAAMRKREFIQLGRLLQKMPVYQVWPSDDPSRVYEFCDTIAAMVQGKTAYAALS